MKKIIIFLRCHADLVEKLDSWIARQPDHPSRPQAVIRLLMIGLRKEKI